MLNARAREDGLRIAVIAFVTLAIATSGLVSSFQTAAAASNVNLWAVPVTSCINDGKLQILRLKFNLENVNPLEKIRITLDPGTADEKILEFDGNGAILVTDPAFDGIDGSIKFKTDGYYFLLDHLKGKFKIGVHKNELTVGDHDALAEIFTEGASSTPSDDAMFKLKACKAGKPDLIAEAYVAPANIKQDKKYHTFFLESNGGTAKAGPHHVSVYLSDDALLDTSVDELIADKHTGALPVNPVRMVQIPIELPCSPDTGEMFLIAWTDNHEVVDESNEGNNVKTDKINVIGCPEAEDAEASDLEEADGDDDDEKGKGKDKGKKND